jgi:hypothetical protein
MVKDEEHLTMPGLSLPPSQAFGKLERNADGQLLAWLPLIDHLVDIATRLGERDRLVTSDPAPTGATSPAHPGFELG